MLYSIACIITTLHYRDLLEAISLLIQGVRNHCCQWCSQASLDLQGLRPSQYTSAGGLSSEAETTVYGKRFEEGNFHGFHDFSLNRKCFTSNSLLD